MCVAVVVPVVWVLGCVLRCPAGVALGLGPARLLCACGTAAAAGPRAPSRVLSFSHSDVPDGCTALYCSSAALAPSFSNCTAVLQPVPQGLGELYADEYVKATVGGASEDKDEKVRIFASIFVGFCCHSGLHLRHLGFIGGVLNTCVTQSSSTCDISGWHAE